MYAAENGHSMVVKKLLGCGANVDAMDKVHVIVHILIISSFCFVYAHSLIDYWSYVHGISLHAYYF